MNTDWIGNRGASSETGVMIGCEDRFYVLCGLIQVIVHYRLDNPGNFGQRDLLIQECGDRLLVRGVHRGRQCTAFT